MEEINKLALLPPEDILKFFKEDLPKSEIEEKSLVSNLKKRLILLLPEKRDDLKKNIIEAMDQAIKTRYPKLTDYLSKSSTTPEGLEEEILVRDRKGKFLKLKEGSLIESGSQSLYTSQGFVPKKGSIGDATKAQGFHFNEEDAREVSRFRKPGAPFRSESLSEILNKTKELSQVNFQDEVLNRRFDTVLLARLKDIRDDIETIDVLRRDTKLGGLGLDYEKSQKIINILKSIQSGKEPKNVAQGASIAKKVPEEPKAPPKIEPVDLSRVAVPKTPQPIKPAMTIEIKKIDVLKNTPIVAPIKLQEAQEAPQLKPILQKPILSDIRPGLGELKTRLVGPIEEISNLTLTDLRRQETGGVRGFVENLINKINLLAEDSLGRKSEGIKAWRKSSLNQLYISIGQESLNYNKSVDQVIEERKAQGKDHLTREELEALADLNEQLRF